MADAPGTCHLVGCPGKGQHPPHGIGAGSWDDYTKPTHCLGFPKVVAVGDGDVKAVCSISGQPGWASCDLPDVSPTDMARLVDRHKAECTSPNAAANVLTIGASA